jgi:hypothetical protein
MSNVEVVGSGFVSKGEIPIFGFVPEEEDNSDGENEDDNLEQAEGNDEDDEDWPKGELLIRGFYYERISSHQQG